MARQSGFDVYIDRGNFQAVTVPVIASVAQNLPYILSKSSKMAGGCGIGGFDLSR